jgi:5-carboxymethyl-2-hydroxymuconate isomerase
MEEEKMPHLILEHSSNIIEKNNLLGLFKKCHALLSETLPTELSSCKSRAIEHTTYYIGNGQENNAFVHVNLKIMPGRPSEIVETVGKTLIDLLKDHFDTSSKQFSLQITLEIQELEKTYFKLSS